MSCTARGEQGAKIKGMAEEHDEQPRGAVDQVQDDRRDGEREKRRRLTYHEAIWAISGLSMGYEYCAAGNGYMDGRGRPTAAPTAKA